MSRNQVSAGLLMCRQIGAELEVFLVHPGGPYFRKKDAGSWTVPKGLVGDGEDLLFAAKREFVEETGFELGEAKFVSVGEIRMKSGKRVHAWAFVGDCDPSALESNTFEIEWPPRSGKKQKFPEVDRAAWFTPDVALDKILDAQRPFIERALSGDTVAALFG